MERVISTPSRASTPTISKHKISIPSSDLLDIKNNFDSCVDDIKKRFAYVDLFSSPQSDPDEKEVSQDILRYQIVSIDSLLDFYMHQILVYGLKKMFNDEWAKTDPYKKMNIPLGTVEYAIQNPENTDWIEEIINQYKNKDSFMHGNEINKVLNYIGVSLNDIADCLGDTPQDLSKKISQLYNRRTQIVHYADINPDTKSKNPISKSEVVDFIDLVKKLCDEIYNAVVDKDATS